MKDSKFKYFKKKILEHLTKLEKKENKEKTELKKSLFNAESIEKGGKGLPVGTIREWKGKKYIKTAPGKWKRKYDSHSRGAKMAIAALKKKIDACTDSTQLMQLVLENRDRFSDDNGRPLPFVKELSDYVSKMNDNIESKNTESKPPKEETKREESTNGKKGYFATQKQIDEATAESDKISMDRDSMLSYLNINQLFDLANKKVEDFEGGIDKFIEYMADKKDGVTMKEVGKKFGELINRNVASKIVDDYNNGVFEQDKNGKLIPKKEEKKDDSKTFDFTLDDIYHIGDGKTREESKRPKTIEQCKQVVKMIAEKYGATEKGRNELSDFIALNIGGSNPLYDKLYEEFNISAYDLDDDFDACHDLMLNQSLGKNTDKEREQIKESGEELRERIREGLENEDKNLKDNEEKEPEENYGSNEYAKQVNDIVDKKANEYKNDWYTKSTAESMIKKLGEKKLQAYAALNLKSDEEFLSETKKKCVEYAKEHNEPINEYTIGTAIWNHYLKVYAKQFAQKKLDSMNANKNDDTSDIPVSEKDRKEAIDIIGADVRRILDGRDVYGNAKQSLTDKIRRRVRNQPGVARAMLMYIKEEQEKTGKKVYTDKHSIWEELPKLNANARESAMNGESETKTGVSGNLYEGEDGTTVVENKDWGRYQISFPGKPDGSIISLLKHNGFRWSPSTKTWVCFNTSNGEYSLKRVAEQLGLKKNDDVKKSLLVNIEDSLPYDNEMDSEDVASEVSEILEEVCKRG